MVYSRTGLLSRRSTPTANTPPSSPLIDSAIVGFGEVEGVPHVSANLRCDLVRAFVVATGDGHVVTSLVIVAGHCSMPPVPPTTRTDPSPIWLPYWCTAA